MHRVVKLVGDKCCFKQGETVAIQVVLITLWESNIRGGGETYG